MARKSSILTLVFAMLTALLAPARFGLACQLVSPASRCPMMAARKSVPKSPCCGSKEPSNAPSLSARCCCEIQPAPEAPPLPDASLVGDSLTFLLGSPALCVPAPEASCAAPRATDPATPAPRGPPLPFASLRAPPSFS